MSLLLRLMLLVVFVIAPVAGIEIYNWHEHRTQRIIELRREAETLLSSVGIEQQRLADGVRHTLAAVSLVADEAVRNETACTQLIDQMRRAQPGWLQIRVSDEKGIVRCATDQSDVGLSNADLPHVARAMSSGRFIAGQFTSTSVADHPHLPFAFRWEDSEERRGVITALVNAAWIVETLEHRPLPPNANLKLVDVMGNLIAHVPHLVSDLEKRELHPSFDPLFQEEMNGVAEVVSLDGRKRIVAYSPVGAEPLPGVFLSVGIDYEAALAALDAADFRSFSIFGTTLLIALIGAWWGANSLIRKPVAVLTGAARRWRDGDRSARANITDRTELGDLGRAFDEMATAIETGERERQQELEARRLAEEALGESKAGYRAIFDSAMEAMVVCDDAGTIVAFNPAAERAFGYSTDEAIGANVSILMPGDYRGAHSRSFQRYVVTGNPTIIGSGREVEGQAKNGDRFPLDISLAEWQSGGRRFFTAIMRDLTARKRAEAAQRASEERFRLVFEHAAIGIKRVGIDGRILEVNRKFCGILGYSAEEIIGKTVDELTHPEDLISTPGLPEVAEVRYVRSDGSYVWVRAASSALHHSGSDEPYCIIVVEDISEQRAAADAMLEAKEQAERADLSKTRFLAAASHDLRQPMQSLLLFAAALAPHVQDDGREVFVQLERGLDAMKGLLDSLLDISSLDAGIVRPQVSDFRIDDLLDRIAGSFGPVAVGKGLRFHVEACALSIRSDRVLLERMLRNLVENAVRYTDRGEIRVGCRVDGDKLRVSVEDTGLGMSKEDLELVWEEFQQLHNPERDRSRGIGLGLTIVRRLSRLLDHPVSVVSEPAKGTLFTILVPLAGGSVEPAPTDAYVDRSVHDGKGRLALVIDDDVIVLMGLLSILRDWEYEVLIAGDAKVAVEQLETTDRIPDVVVADYRLRGGKIGTEAIFRVRKAAGADIPGIILTGEIGSAPQRDAATYGLGLIHKPVTPRQLASAIDYQIKTSHPDRKPA